MPPVLALTNGIRCKLCDAKYQSTEYVRTPLTTAQKLYFNIRYVMLVLSVILIIS